MIIKSPDELSVRLVEARLCEQAIKQARADLKKKEENLWEAINQYSSQRFTLLREEIRKRELDWCTCCYRLFSATIFKFILTEGVERRDSRDTYGHYDFCRFYHACPECFESMMDRHGKTGEADFAEKKKLIFHAFRVEKQEDGYYARKFGEWVKLEEKECVLPNDFDTWAESWDGRKALIWEANADWELPLNFKCKDGEIILIEKPYRQKFERKVVAVKV